MYDDDDSAYVNDHKSENALPQEIEKDALIKEIQDILNAGHSVSNEASLLNIVQKQRKLILDIATSTFLKKPNNPKLMDSINTLLGQMEKSVRDDRKERLRDRELEDNKANFATFVNALNEVANGRLTLPTFSNTSLNLDPLGDPNGTFFVTDDPDDEISDAEKYQGRQILDSKKIQESFDIDGEVQINHDETPEDTSEFDPNL